MSDQLWTRIIFPAFALRIPEVIDAIDKEQPEERDAAIGDREAPAGSLMAIAGNTYGDFDTLRPVLQNLRIGHDLWTEADFERAELVVYYRPGETKRQDYHFRQYCANGMPIFTKEEIMDLVKKARTGVATGKALKEFLNERSVPPLSNFVTPPARLKKHLTLTDPTTLKDYDIGLCANAVVRASVRVTATCPEEAQRLAHETVCDSLNNGIALGKNSEKRPGELTATITSNR